jgi:hypothetical protein
MERQERKEYIVDWFGLKSWLHFTYVVRILPIFRPHVHGYVYDWVEEKIKPAYWIKDKNDFIIPWAHFDKSTIMCCTMDEYLNHVEKA